MKLNGTRQLLVYADDVNVLGGSVHSVWKKTDTLAVANKENGVEDTSKQTKCMIMSRDRMQIISQHKDRLYFLCKFITVQVFRN